VVKVIVVSTLTPARMAHRLAPLPQMRDNDAPGGETERDLAPAARDVFIAKAMKPVVADTRVLVFPRQREARGDRRHCVMKGGIEAGDLRQARPQRHDRSHRRETMRLVQGCQRRQCLQRRQDRVGHLHGAL
jgi:hypothetical protein